MSTAPAKVLVIDDDPIVLEVIRERLEAAGHQVTTRHQALGTSRVVRELEPDVVLLDLMMPALSGEALAHLLRSHRLADRVGIVLHSSKSEAELREAVRQTGALGAIAKSCSEEEFLASFSELLAQHRGA